MTTEFTREIGILDGVVERTIQHALDDLGPKIFSGDMNQVIKNKEPGEVTRGFDWEIEQRLVDALYTTGIPLRIDSEEREVVDRYSNPRYLVIIDPLDGSDMAARGYLLCSIAVSIVDLSTMRAVASRIGDFGTRTQFAAIGDSCKHSTRTIRPSSVSSLDQAFIVSYGAKRDRIAGMVDLMPVIAGCGLYLNYGGPMDIAKIATGQVDIFIEISKGMAARDTLPGMHILQRAGGVILSPDGQRIDGAQLLDGRRKFIAASNGALAAKALERLNAGR